MAELLSLSKKNKRRLSQKDQKALDSARSAIEMKIKVQKDASKRGDTKVAQNIQSQIDRAVARFNKNITKYRKSASIPVIKSPTDSSKRRPTRAEREDERRKREEARRRSLLGPKGRDKIKSYLGETELEKDLHKTTTATKKTKRDPRFNRSSPLLGPKGRDKIKDSSPPSSISKRTDKTTKPKVGTPAFKYKETEPIKFGPLTVGQRKKVWDAGEVRPKDVPKGDDWESFLWGGKPKKKVVVDKPLAVARRGDTKYTIRSGDTLEALARKKGTTLGAIRRANPGRFPTAKSLNIIKAGEKINMPPNVGAKTPYDVKTVPVKPKKIKAKVTGIESPSHRSPVKTKTSPVKGVESPSHRSPVKKDKVKSSLSDPKFSGGVATGVRPPLKPLEGGVRYKKLPDWLGGGEIKIDSTFEEEKGDNVTHGKKGGQVKKGVKKIKARKAKPRKRAALRGHRAELRGG